MAIDPRNYDLDELRSVSVGQPSVDETDSDGHGVDEWPGGFEAALDTQVSTPASEPTETDDAEPTESDRPAAAAAFEETVARELTTLDAESGPAERPYLDTLPATMTAEMLVFEWLEFLFLQAGRESVTDALAFYERIGWLGSDAADALDAYLSGLDDLRSNDENALDADDHRVSLRYVARLAALDGE